MKTKDETKEELAALRSKVLYALGDATYHHNQSIDKFKAVNFYFDRIQELVVVLEEGEEE